MATQCYQLCFPTGKSAGMILRQINPGALAEAHAVHLDETCTMLQQCSLTDNSPSQAAGPLQQGQAQAR